MPTPQQAVEAVIRSQIDMARTFLCVAFFLEGYAAEGAAFLHVMGPPYKREKGPAFFTYIQSLAGIESDAGVIAALQLKVGDVCRCLTPR